MDFLENPNEHLDYPVEKPLCGICGDPHSYRECKYITISSQIKDTMVPTRARLSLPHQLEIKKLADESEVICAKCFISSGTEFGPFVAKKNLTLHPLAPFPLKVFSNKESELSECYLDTTDENECCWMMFVRSAEDIEEQNLVCYQESEDIYFSTIRDIQPGEELRMWYSPYYAFRMQKKVLTFKEVPQTEVKGHIMANNPKEDEEVEMISNIIKQQQKIIPTIIWNCKFCYKLEKNVTRFAEHLLTHYSASIRKDKICHHCQKKFQYIKEYRAHLRAAHKTLQDPRKSSAKKSITRENIDSPTVRPSDPLLIDSTKSPDVLKNSSKKASLSGRKVLGDTQLLNQRFIDTVGGPLLLQFAQDTQDSSNSCLLQPGIGSFDLGTYDSGLDNDMLQFTNLICNNLDEDNSVKEPDKSNGFVCDICLKKFQTKKSVRDHLSLHIGRFFCKTCKKVFGRSENYKNHKCNHKYILKCPKCEKIFYQKKYLVQHISSYHDKKFSCPLCQKSFLSAFKLRHHTCNNDPKKIKSSISLPQKGKHSGANFTIKLVCSECSQIFSSHGTYQRHVATVHKKIKSYPCEKCHKVFHRADTLKNHIASIHTTNQEEMVFKCTSCNKHFSNQRNLNKHINQSHQPTAYSTCTLCHSTFKHQRNLTRHMKIVHQNSFHEQDKLHECPVCNLKMKLKNSLQRHVRKQHPERYKHLCIEQTAKKDESKLLRYRCPKCLKSLKMKNSMKRHFMSKHENEYEKLCGQLDECIVIPKNRMEVKEQKTFDEVDQYIDLQKTIENMDFNIDASIDNLIGSETIDKFLKESSDQISILLADSPKPSSNVHIISDIVLTDRITNREVDLPLRTAPGNTTILTDRITNREVGLSMPDLSDIDQEVKSFGKNRVEAVPLNDDVTVYVLNEKLN
ncbi:PR domain zinc finger protein 15-like isoform X1 [Anthonomus grandis grandis]|uniref:PR domain zinc finger protein 15-like isoform X1 n=1 Tax=Anthonomus grandis grandis TaxID=2921223 RepID=UPI002165B2BB|nr:PR domain zinc finger protein 15-like isoform X1 [Anthonomus grandis grandis]